MHFGEKLALGYPAGDIGTSDEPQWNLANGVDCIGFIGQVWRTGTRLNMPRALEMMRPIRFQDLRAGDVVQRYISGSTINHVVLFRNWINYDPGVDGEPFVGAQFMAYEAALKPNKVVVSTYELTGIDVANPTTKYFRGQGYLTDKVQIKRIEYCDPIDCGTDGLYEDPDYYPYTYLNPIDVVLVIDRSGSMSGNKLSMAKQSAKMFIDLMRPGDKIGVVAFGSTTSVVYPLQEILATGADIKGDAKNAIDTITASGGTPMGAGLQLGQQQLNTNGQSDPIRLMLLLSDGVENGSPTADQVLPGIIADKITVHTLALGIGADVEKLQNIAGQTGGVYRFALADGMTDIFYAIYSKVYGEGVVKRVSGTVDPNSTVEQYITVDSTIGSMNFSLNWPGSDLDLTLVRPDGTIVDPNVAGSDPDITFTSNLTYEFYTVYAPQPGVWTMKIFGKSTGPSGENYIASVSAMDAMIVSADFDKTDYVTGTPIKLTASVEDSSLVDPLGTEYIRGATMLVTAEDPAQSQYSFELYDDGLHADGAADDGVYANTFADTGLEGSYNFNVQIAGTNNLHGQAFTREYSLSTVVKALTFPTTGILDDFNRADGSIGSNWYGNTASYNISSNQLLVKSKNANLDIYWNTASFGPDQEAYFTFSSVNTTSVDQDLILKSQYVYGWAYGLIDIQYEASANRVVVWTYDHNQSWVQYGADIPVMFVNGDQFGARALSNGTVEVYRNGALIATRDISAWPYNTSGGYIGLWFGNAKDARVDDFGGGTVP